MKSVIREEKERSSEKTKLEHHQRRENEREKGICRAKERKKLQRENRKTTVM